MYVRLLHNIPMYRKGDAVANYIIGTQVEPTVVDNVSVGGR